MDFFGVMNTRMPACIESNLELLKQGSSVLSGIDDRTYTRPCLMFDGQRIGGHVRHIVDFYETLLDGVPLGRVDYDARRRDPAVQADRSVAIVCLEHLIGRLRSMDAEALARPLLASCEGAGGAEWIRSSVGRELEATRSHTVHHFALIAMLMRCFGLRTPEDFGVSKATLQYRARMSEAA